MGVGNNMSLIIKYIRGQLNKSRNFCTLCVGRVGTGKSYSAMRFAETLDPDFNVDKVVFKIEDLLEMVHDESIPAGSVIVFDEGGIAISNRNHYMNKFNKAMAMLLQTWRHRNIILFVTVPDISFVDAGIRKLFDATMESQEVIKSRKVVQVKWKFTQLNNQSGKLYYKNAKLKSKILRIEIKKPSIKLIHAYEKKKKEFTTELYKNLQAELKPEEKEEENNIRRCTECGGLGSYFPKLHLLRCRGCGHEWEHSPHKITNV